MVVRATAHESALDGATASFMRSMLGIGGRLFADMGEEQRPSVSLSYLCESARDLLGAERVAVRLHEDAIGLSGVFESTPQTAGNSTSATQLTADIGGLADVPIGQLELTWADPQRQPTPLDELVATRLATMANLLLERHLSKRRQLQAIAQEREAFAGEIHDDPIQVMTAVSLQLQRVAARLPVGGEREAVHEARTLNDNAMERLRHVMFSMHPTTLPDDGLVASIEDYCESFVAPEGLEWKVNGACPETMPLEVAALAFRLCRNALVNVMEHAEADSVVVDVSRADGAIRIEVRDDGVGFDLAQVRHTRVGHLGIPHAVTLARWVGGTYVTRSEANRGTTVTIELPII